MKKIATTVGGIGLILLSSAVGAQQLQPAYEVQVQQSQNQNAVVPGAVKLPDEGCTVQTPTPSCQKRIICVGRATIRVKGPDGVRMARKAALIRANSAVSYFQNTVNKGRRGDAEGSSASGQIDGAGKSTNYEINEKNLETSYQETNALLQGVDTLGSEVDISGGEVKIYVGQSCRSISTAQGLEQQQSSGQPQVSGGNSAQQNLNSRVMGGPSINEGTATSYKNLPTNDF